MRTKYLIGTTITSVVLMAATMVWAFPIMNQAIDGNGQFNMLGHVTLMAEHPDGTIDYIQGDNLIVDVGETAAALALWADTDGVGWNCIGLGKDAAPAVADNEVDVDTVAATARICADDGGGGDSVTVSQASTGALNDKTDIVVVFTIDAGDNTAIISEVGLFNASGAGAGTMMSHFVLATGVTVSTNTVLTVTYTMETG